MRIRKPRMFGIQIKLLLIPAFVSLSLLFTAAYVLYGLRLISNSSKIITEREIPLTRGISGALLAMQEAKFSLEEAFAVDNPSQIDEVEKREANLKENISVFDAYLAAITWGSETESFYKSDEGRNFVEWQRLGLAGVLKIQPPPERRAQLAGVTDIYFGGFAQNALRAIENHKRFLMREQEGASSIVLQEEIVKYKDAARHFSELAIGTLSEAVGRSNISIAQSAEDIQKTQRNVKANIFWIFAASLFLSPLFSLLFVRRSIVRPLESLTAVAQKIRAGDFGVRAKTRSRDEIGMLARAFNDMADHLAEYPEELERTVGERTKSLTKLNQTLQYINKELETRNRDLDKAAKALVQRDLEFSDVRRKQEDQLVELDRAAKALVRRDLELLRLNDALQETDKAKSHFVSVAAHQLRTPLSITKWTFRMLLGGDFGLLSEEQKKVLQRGFEVNEGMIRLVGDLLDVARIETGKFLYNFELVSVEEILEEVISVNKENAQARHLNLTLTRKTTEEIPFLWLDKENIEIALQNLVTNAMYYTLPGGKVEVLYEKDEDVVKISVKDTGVGVPKHQIGRLFEKFFRGDNVVRMQTQGTGLGLFIVASIVRAHKGQVGVESEEGKGSTFWFTLPIKS